jgi:hypothetical protein
MSYDLFFYNKKDSHIDINEIFAYLNNKLNISDNKNNSQWFFQNKETGTYFSIDYSTHIEEDEVDFGSEYKNSGFSFNINYLRPEFFGIEAFPYIDEFCNKYNFLVYNPQGEEKLLSYSNGQLFRDWKEINKRNSIEYFKKQNLNYLELGKSNYTWEYCVNREKLQNGLTEDIFIAGIFYNKLINTDEVLTLSVWPECIPVILPKTDNVYIMKKMKKTFGIKEEKGFVQFDVLVEKFHGLIKKYKIAELECFILNIEDSAKAKAIFNDLEINMEFEKRMKGLSVEEIVNYK